MTLLAHHELAGLRRHGRRHGDAADARTAAASCGWRTSRRRRTSPASTSPTRASRKLVVQTDLPHMKMRSNSLDVVGRHAGGGLPDAARVGIQPAGFDLFDISDARDAAADLALRLLGPAFARRARAVVRRRRDRAHGERRRATSSRAIRWTTSSTASSTCRNPAQAGRGGPLVVPRHARRRRRAAAGAPAAAVRHRLSRPQHQRVPRAARTAPTSATSTAAPFVLDIADKSRIEGRVAVEPLAALQRLHPHGAAAVRPRPAGSSATSACRTTAPTGPSWCGWSTRATRPTRCRSAPSRRRRSRRSRKRGGRFGAHNLHENLPVPTLVPLGHDHHRHLLQRRRARVRHDATRTACEEIAYYVPGAPKLSPAGAIQLNDVYVDERRIVTRWTASPAGCTSWRWTI